MNVRDTGRRWVHTLTGKPELDELDRFAERAALLDIAIAEEVALQPLTREDLDDVVDRVARVAECELRKRRRGA